MEISKTEKETIAFENKQKEEMESQGSNGIAISGKLTQSGNTMLLINPHTSFFFRGEGLNAYGTVTWGSFLFIKVLMKKQDGCIRLLTQT